MQGAGAAPVGAGVAAVEPALAGQVVLAPAEQRESEKEPVSGGEPETEKTAWGERMAEGVQGEAEEAGLAGREGEAGPGHGVEAASGAVLMQQPGADSATRSGAAAVGVVRGVSVGAGQEPAVCESEVVAVLEAGAGWEAETLTAKPGGRRRQRGRSTLLASMWGAGWISVGWKVGPGQSRSVPGAPAAAPGALAAELMNPSRSHCPGGWGCWVTCSGCPGQCLLGRCCLHR